MQQELFTLLMGIQNGTAVLENSLPVIATPLNNPPPRLHICLLNELRVNAHSRFIQKAVNNSNVLH